MIPIFITEISYDADSNSDSSNDSIETGSSIDDVVSDDPGEGLENIVDND